MRNILSYFDQWRCSCLCFGDCYCASVIVDSAIVLIFLSASLLLSKLHTRYSIVCQQQQRWRRVAIGITDAVSSDTSIQSRALLMKINRIPCQTYNYAALYSVGPPMQRSQTVSPCRRVGTRSLRRLATTVLPAASGKLLFVSCIPTSCFFQPHLYYNSP